MVDVGQVGRLLALSPGATLLLELPAGAVRLAAGPELSRLGHDPAVLAAAGDGALAILLHPDDLPTLRQQLANLAAAPDGTVFESRCRCFARGPGHWRWHEARLAVLEPPAPGEPALAYLNLLPVGQVPPVVATAARADARLRAFATCSPFGLFETDAEGLCIWSSDRWHELSGLTAEESLGYGWVRVIHPADRDRAAAAWQAFVETEAPRTRIDFRIVRPDGEARWVETHAALSRGPDGRRLGWFGTVVDVTDRERAREEVASNEAQLRTLALEVPIVLFRMDAAGRVTYLTAASERVIGGTAPLTGEAGLLGVVHPDDRDEVAAALRHTLERREPLRGRYRLVRGDGRTIWVEVCLDPATDGGHVGCMLDVSDAMAAAIAIEESEERFRSLAQHAPVAIFRCDAVGNLEYANDTWCRYSGRRLVDCLGAGWQEALHPDDHERVVAEWREALSSGLPVRTELRFRQPDGTVLTLENVTTPVHDRQGRITCWIGMLVDVTDRHALLQRLRDREKLESLGTLAGGIAHDFNNVLAVVMGYLELLQDESDPEFARQAVEACLTAVHRGRDLVRQILTYTRRERPVSEQIDLVALVRDTLRLVRATLPATIGVRQHFGEGLPPVVGDRTQLTQVLLNLVANAEHAMRVHGEGLLEVSVDSVVLPEPAECYGLRLEAGPAIRLRIADDGAGMGEETLARLCDPFFTTKPAGEGTGMGLAVVHGVLATHHATMRVTSQQGRGSTFELLFPAAEIAAGRAAPSVVSAEALPHGPVRVGLCDDEPALRSCLAAALRHGGYGVREFGTAAECVAAVAAEPDAFDVIVTDQSMPGLTGDQLTEALRAICPSLPVIIVTGYSPRLTPDRLAALGSPTVLTKPVSGLELRRSIARAVAT